jgi:predicted exporter
VLTTVASALALALSSFKGLAQLGVLTMVGVVAAGLASSWIIPWLLGGHELKIARLRVPPSTKLEESRWPRIAAFAVTLCSLAALWFAYPDWWERDLAAISPVPAAMRAQDASLRREMGAPEVSVFLASHGASEASALEAAEALLPTLDQWQAEGLVRGYDSPARYLPAPATQAARRQSLPDAATLQANLREALRGLEFRPDALQPFLDDVAAARSAPALGLADYAGTPLGTRLNAQVIALDGRWLVLTSLRGASDLDRMRATLATSPGTQLVDLKDISGGMLDRFRGEAIRQSALGALLICVILAVGLRSLSRTARVIAPVAAALPVTMALLAAAGQRIGVFHLVALLLVMGIGLNYALFFERPAADEEERGRTRVALALCSTSTVITFGCLAFSATPVLHAIGATVAIGAALCLVLAALWARAGEPAGGSSNPS